MWSGANSSQDDITEEENGNLGTGQNLQVILAGALREKLEALGQAANCYFLRNVPEMWKRGGKQQIPQLAHFFHNILLKHGVSLHIPDFSLVPML